MFWCYMAVARAALSHSSETGEARASQPTQMMRRIGRAHESRDLTGTALPDRSRALPSCTPRVEPAAWGNTYLENLPRDPHSSASAGGASFRGTDIVPYLE